MELIVILDGYFHTCASIWPREILAALRAGIAVVGAASLGAIRAAELSKEGMVGIGRIFQGFSSGDLVGDDEVALLHGDEESGYRPISDPLVEFRVALDGAVARSLVTPQERWELLAELGELYFGERTRASLFRTRTFDALAATQGRKLRAYIEGVSFTAKREDALEALRFCATHRDALVSEAARNRSPLDQSITELAQRGVLRGDGELHSLQNLLASQPYRDEDVGGIIRGVRRRFLILHWMQGRRLEPPAEALALLPNHWTQEVPDDEELACWLGRNAMRRHEFEAEWRRRATCEWLESLPNDADEPAIPRRKNLSAGDACLLDWAEKAGIRAPGESREAPQACIDWLLLQGPGYFGLGGSEEPAYNEDLALIRDFQFRGWIAKWAGAGSQGRPAL
ncbi:MAG: TfuA domain-containing protein [Candidatus Binatia bacterium]|nr:TfuA domain-containing protein [Candidatus Binatia bacterium]